VGEVVARLLAARPVATRSPCRSAVRRGVSTLVVRRPVIPDTVSESSSDAPAVRRVVAGGDLARHLTLGSTRIERSESVHIFIT